MWTHPIETSGAGGKRGRANGVYLGGATIRLRHRRSGFGGLRAGGPPKRGWPGPRALARVRWSRRLDLHSDALGAVHSDEHAEVQLVLSHRARAAPGRKKPAHPARQGAGRLIVHQRSRLHSRQSSGFRAVGGGGRRGVGVPRRIAVFQTCGAPPGGRRPVPRRFRQADDELRIDEQPAARGVARGRRASGLSPQQGRQRLSARGLRPYGHDRG